MPVFNTIEYNLEKAIVAVLTAYVNQDSGNPLQPYTENFGGAFDPNAVVLPHVHCIVEAMEETPRHSGIYACVAECELTVSLDDTLPGAAEAMFGTVRDCFQQTDLQAQLQDVPEAPLHIYGYLLDQPARPSIYGRQWQRSLKATIIAQPSENGTFESSSSSSSTKVSLTSSGSSQSSHSQSSRSSST